MSTSGADAVRRAAAPALTACSASSRCSRHVDAELAGELVVQALVWSL
jgi:hypothetical protein